MIQPKKFQHYHREAYLNTHIIETIINFDYDEIKIRIAQALIDNILKSKNEWFY